MQPLPRKTKTSLHLLGGGVTGVFFHVGALAALDDHLSLKSTEHNRYVGVSAGALVATSCALGLSPQEAAESVIKGDQKLFKITRRDIYRFSFLDWGVQILKTLWTVFYLIFLKINYGKEAPSFFWGLKDSFPSGFFSPRYYEDWIRQFFENLGYPRFFSELNKELYIPAFNIDSCKRVVFGEKNWKHIPFSKAIAASSSIPIFFKPVQIENQFYTDGGLGRMAHLDLSAENGVDLVIMINPMVPVDNSLDYVRIKTVFEDKGRIKDKGFTYVFDQAMRMEIKLRTEAALNYAGYRFPETDILTIEPEMDDPTMFLFNPMEFESRRQIVEYAYEVTRKRLKQNKELWKNTLSKHNITIVGV